jgi:hypothetical protein
VTNGLIVRSYPAPGVEIVPSTFGAGPYGYSVLELLPVAALIWFGIALRNVYPRPQWLWYGVVISVLGFFFVLAFLRSVRLEIRADGVSYASLLRREKFAAYRDISSVVLIDYRHLRSEASPRRSLRTYTAIITPNIETGGTPFKIPLTLFPDFARSEFVRMFKPEVWESGG